MLINGGLNKLYIGVGDGPFSDSQWQHNHCISEKGFGFQLVEPTAQRDARGNKKKVRKVFGNGDLTRKSVEKWACLARPVGPEDRIWIAPVDGTWVEMKNCGLKIGVILAPWTY